MNETMLKWGLHSARAISLVDFVNEGIILLKQ